MSRNEFEENYEDELDRMRAHRRQRKNSEISHSSSRKKQTELFYDIRNDMEESDYDYDIDLEAESMEEFSGYGPELSPAVSKSNASKSRREHRSIQLPVSSRQERSGHSHLDQNHGFYTESGRADKCSANGRSYPSHNSKGNNTLSKKPKKVKNRKGRHGKLKIFLLAVFLISAVLYGKRWMKDRDGYWNIAVFGVDSRDSNLGKGALADVQMIASINKKTGEIRLVSVFRDTYVQINDEGDFHKINEAYFKGGHQQALDVLERNLDIHVDDYATFNWKAVADAINILGGIDLEITDSEFRYINSFITETVESTGVYSQHLQNAGWNHLDGVQAVAYSRLRLMDTDFNRTERQRKVVALALEKAKQADFNTLKIVAGTVIPEISTSIGIEDIIPLARNVKRYHLGETAGFPFAKTTAYVGKMDCVIPMTLESNVILLHQFLFGQENYQPSASVKTISAKICEKTGIYEEGKSAGSDGNLIGDGSGNAQNPGNTNQENPPATDAAPDSGEIVSEPVTSEAPESTEIEETEESEPKETADETANPTVVEPLPEETTLSEEQLYEGPGALNPPSQSEADNHIKPTVETTEEYGPGFE